MIKLLKLTRPFFSILLLSFLCSLLAALGQLIFLFLSFHHLLITDFSWKIAYLLLGIIFVLSVASFLEQYLGHLVAFKLLANLRNRIYAQLRKLAPAKLDVQHSGALLKLINSDIEIVEVFFAHTIVPVLLAISFGGIVSASYWQLDWRIGSYVALTYLVLGGCVPFFNRRNLIADNQKMETVRKDVQQYMLETIRGKEDLWQLNAVGRRQAGLAKLFKKEHQLTQQQLYGQDKKSYLINFLLLFFWLGLFGLSIYSQPLTPVMKAAILAYPFSFTPFLALANLSMSLSKALLAAENIFSFLEERSLIQTKDKQHLLSTIKTIEVNGLSFAYPNSSQLILENVSLEIHEGEFIGLMGASGSGKSTLTKILMKWYPYQTGKICLNQHELADLTEEEVRQQINYLPQHAQLFQQSIAENLSLGKSTISEEQMWVVLKKVQLDQRIEKMPQKLATSLNQARSILSAGEIQRLEVARALLHPSSLLVLDEPTSNLDSENEKLILQYLRQHYQGTVIIITHRLDSLAICDRVYELTDKRLAVVS